jgi:hypothetical protein
MRDGPTLGGYQPALGVLGPAADGMDPAAVDRDPGVSLEPIIVVEWIKPRLE